VQQVKTTEIPWKNATKHRLPQYFQSGDMLLQTHHLTDSGTNTNAVSHQAGILLAAAGAMLMCSTDNTAMQYSSNKTTRLWDRLLQLQTSA
jgi:hypothetical protein